MEIDNKEKVKKVNEMRERTGAGMAMSKLALEKNDWNIEKAINWLRKVSLC